MGAGNIFRTFYNLPADIVIPLSNAHGVDWDYSRDPFDILSPEPIHWSTCKSLQNHNRVPHLKPILFAPHPWILNIHNRDLKIEEGQGALLIGPPPSPENDEALYKLIKSDLQNQNYSILIKARGNYLGSIDFWESKGVRCFSAGKPDDDFYSRLFEIINMHKEIISGSFSSAVVFGSSIGKKIRILETYKFKVFEITNSMQFNDYSRASARKIILSYADQSALESQLLSQELLGFEMLGEREKIKDQFLDMRDSLKEPFFNQGVSYISLGIRKFLATKLSKPGLLNITIVNAIKKILLKPQVSVITYQEFNIWRNGINKSNFDDKIVKINKYMHAPSLGDAPNGYDR